MSPSRSSPVALLAILSLLASAAARAEDQPAAPGGKEGKIVYDLTEGGGKALLDRLDSIEETRQDLIKQGITPRFVISFRGPSTKLVQTNLEKIKPEDRPFAAPIAARVLELSKAPGVDALEQCAVAIRHQGTKAENVVAPI